MHMDHILSSVFSQHSPISTGVFNSWPYLQSFYTIEYLITNKPRTVAAFSKTDTTCAHTVWAKGCWQQFTVGIMQILLISSQGATIALSIPAATKQEERKAQKRSEYHLWCHLCNLFLSTPKPALSGHPSGRLSAMLCCWGASAIFCPLPGTTADSLSLSPQPFLVLIGLAISSTGSPPAGLSSKPKQGWPC